MTSLVIPSDVTSIGDCAFYNCKSITSIAIPDSVTSIGNYAFCGCSSLKSVYISDLTAWMNISFGDSSANPLCNGADLYLNGEKLTNLVIPSDVTSIGYCAFYNCKSITSIAIPDSVTSIGYRAFYGCSSLTSVTIPEGVTSIGDYAFAYCDSLTSVTIGSGVTSIGTWVFAGCTKLVGANIYFTGTKAQWRAISRADKWWAISGYDSNYKAIGSVVCTDGFLSTPTYY